MTAPHRRPLRRDNLDIHATLEQMLAQAKAAELGWSQALEQARDAGWPERSPITRANPRITILCRECRTQLAGSQAKDAHQADTGHQLYGYTPVAPIEPSVIDYHDPTGDLAPAITHVHDDLLEMQDAWRQVCKQFAVITGIAKRYLPTAWSSEEPACWYFNECGNSVESNGKGGYRGMERIADHWVARPNVRPVCAMHRTRERRDVA